MLKARAEWRAAPKREREKRDKQEELRRRWIARIALEMVEAGACRRDRFMADMDRFPNVRGDRELFGVPPREAEGVEIVDHARKGGG